VFYLNYIKIDQYMIQMKSNHFGIEKQWCSTNYESARYFS